MRARYGIGLALAAAIVIAVGLIRWAPWRMSLAAPSGLPPPAAPAVALATARFGTFVERVAAHGRVGPPDGADAKLAFAGSGILTRLDVSVGEPVARGTPLAEYAGGDVARAQLAAAQARVATVRSHLEALERGTGSAQSDRTAAETALRASEAKVSLDRETLNRERELFRGGVAAEKDVEAASEQLALDANELQANAAKAKASGSTVGEALTQARSDYAGAEGDAAVAARTLDNTVLRAPADGVVVAILKHLGEGVDPGTPVIELGPAGGDVVTLTVVGADARRIRKGASVELVDSTLSARGAGYVRGFVPSVDPTTQATTVLVAGTPPGALNGDAIDASIVLGSRRGVIVPTSAIVADPSSGATLVFVRTVRKDGNASFEPRRISVLAEDSAESLVAGALRSGERIAAQGAFDLLAPSGG